MTRKLNPWPALASLCLLLLLAALGGRSGVGQTNLGLTALLSNNAVQISITNAFTNATYDLFSVAWFQGTGSIPWTLVQTGTLGQTTYTVPITPALSGFFVVATNDINHNGVLNYEDPGSGTNPLAIYIESPTNGATIY